MPAAATPVDLPPHFAAERQALVDHWTRSFRRLETKGNRPSAPLSRLINGTSTADDVRKVHDKFGWAAKNKVKCVGALYRTRAFMAIPRDLRDASKPRGVPRAQWPRNIHIEHTIPASQLHAMWLADPYTGPLPEAWFLANGITTAMHVDEERCLSGDNHAENPCFEEGQGLPFQRYSRNFDELEIFNLVTGVRILPETYTMAHHRATLAVLMTEAGASDAWVDAIHAAAA